MIRSRIVLRSRGTCCLQATNHTKKELQRNDLWEKYEGRAAGKADTISRYLQHCTEQRVEVKSWNIPEMLREITPTIDGFEDLLPSKQRRWEPPPKSAITLSRTDFSTATTRVGYAPVLYRNKD
jgi:hypothetical protein